MGDAQLVYYLLLLGIIQPVPYKGKGSHLKDDLSYSFKKQKLTLSISTTLFAKLINDFHIFCPTYGLMSAAY